MVAVATVTTAVVVSVVVEGAEELDPVKVWVITVVTTSVGLMTPKNKESTLSRKTWECTALLTSNTSTDIVWHAAPTYVIKSQDL